MAAPRILFVAPKIPYPPDTGWNQRMCHTLTSLAAMGPVSLACYAHRGDRQSELEFAPVKDLCAGVHVLDETDSRWPIPVRSHRDLAEGLALVPERHISIADTPARFADAVVQLLNDPARRRAMAVAGRALVAERYTWDAIGARTRGALGDWLSRPARSIRP